MREKKKKRTGQSEIPVAILVEQKTGILAVLSTPLIELPIQKTLKNAKNWSRKCFMWNIFAPTTEKQWLGKSPNHARYKYHEALHNDWLHNTPDKKSIIHRSLTTEQSMINANGVTIRYTVAAMSQCIYCTEYRRNKAFTTFLWVSTPPLLLAKHWPAASGTPWATLPTTYLPYRIQTGTKRSLPPYGFRLPATFAQIPTWGG